MEDIRYHKIVDNNFELNQILKENSQVKEKNTVLVASIFLAGAIVLGILIYYKEQGTKRKELQL
ncbi:hypothetical protein IU405_06060 [Polaribacter sp. BAL334]|uniref:hypothetical protein n=1 Tax=Polaribacter sp. BAL334 TaxID=1708178 RepID=UPI0018D24E57|nr:hypothetical protein [Polaribacter sp. BAL334]MBG7611806.1 hypothetical protein [Polaribacter sp. BAL334]